MKKYCGPLCQAVKVALYVVVLVVAILLYYVGIRALLLTRLCTGFQS